MEPRGVSAAVAGYGSAVAAATGTPLTRSGDDEEEEVVATGVVRSGDISVRLGPNGVAIALNSAIDQYGSLEAVLRKLSPADQSALMEQIPLLSAYYVGARPETIARTRDRLMRTQGGVCSERPRAYARRNVRLHIPTVNTALSRAEHMGDVEQARRASLASEHASGARGTVQRAAFWVNAIEHITPMLMRRDDTVHPFLQNAYITRALVDYMRDQHTSRGAAEAVSSARIWAGGEHAPEGGP